MNFWQGKNVRLRGVEPSDAETFWRWNAESEMGRSLEFLWPPISQALVKKQVEETSFKKLEDDAFHWIIEDAGGAAVGSIATHHCNPRNGTFMYGVHIAPEHRGKGLAAEAIRLVVRYYFEELRYRKVNVEVHGYNEASIRMHEKIGFVREGTLRRMIFTGGEYFDVHCYGMLREEWRSRRLTGADSPPPTEP